MYQGQTVAAAWVRWGFLVAAAATQLACDEMTWCERSRLLSPQKNRKAGLGSAFVGGEHRRGVHGGEGDGVHAEHGKCAGGGGGSQWEKGGGGGT